MPPPRPNTGVTAPPKSASSQVEIREALWSDALRMAEISQIAFWDSVVSSLISPLRGTYPEDQLCAATRRVKARMLDARGRGVVAVGDGQVVGFMQCVRLGDDEGASRVKKEKKTWWMGWASWGWDLYGKFAGWAWPDRGISPEGLATFVEAQKLESDKHWNGREDRKNRWDVQTVVVAEEWRGRGVGKKMMAYVLERAQKEGVVVGVKASKSGELLYRSVGFDLLDRFTRKLEEDDANHGGVMIWRPK